MRYWIALLLPLVLTGCSSIRTSMWTRAEDDSLHEDPCTNLKGIPVMLKVPSHLEIQIVETLYAAHDPESNSLQVVKLKRPDLRVEAQLKYTEKMFLVDPVKVISGQGAYGFGFGPTSQGQPEVFPDGSTTPGSSAGYGYLHSANYKAVDNTIKDAGALLGTVLSLTSAKSQSIDAASLNLVTIDSVVAFRRFDLSACDVNEEVLAFMDLHLNRCHDCLNNGQRPYKDPTIVVPAPLLSPVENGGAFRGKMAARGKGIFTSWGSG